MMKQRHDLYRDALASIVNNGKIPSRNISERGECRWCGRDSELSHMRGCPVGIAVNALDPVWQRDALRAAKPTSKVGLTAKPTSV